MKTKTLLSLWSLANLILFAWIFLSWRLGDDDSGGPKWVPSETAAAEQESLEGPVPPEEPLVSDVKAVHPKFRWAQIESEDYAKYVRNLRSVGCPETTIQDIVEADINAIFEPRYAALLGSVQSYEYWRNGISGGKGEGELRAARAALDQERTELLQELLGDNYRPKNHLASLTSEEIVNRSKYAFLPAEMQDAVAEVFAVYEANTRALQLDSSLDSQDRKTQLAALKAEQRLALQTLLSEEELFELDLRDSHAARSLRQKLGKFEVSEDEFRELFALRQQYEADYGEVPDYTDPEKMAARASGKQLLEAGYEETLGGDRYVDLSRKNDRQWQRLAEAADEHSLDRESMEAAYQLHREARSELLRASRDPELDDETRLVLVEAARAQYDRELAQLIGDEAAQSVGSLPSQQPIRLTSQNGAASAEFLFMGAPGGAESAALEITGDILQNIMPDGADGAQISVMRIGQPVILDAAPVAAPVPAPLE